MFDQMVVSSVHGSKTNKPWTVALSMILQVLVVGVLILIPLIYTEALPQAMLSTFLVAPPPPPPPPPPAPKTEVIKKIIVQAPQKMVAPTVIPKKIEIVKDQAPDIGAEGGTGVAGGTGVPGGIIAGLGGPPPPPPPKPATPQRIRVGGNVEAAKLQRQILPIYPQIARTAHISGTVVLHAVIAKDGSIQELTYVSGPALLMRAAMDAVRQWHYAPTQLNGEPVEVDTTIQVVFSLGGD
jgi:periplasmic protein TonB